MKVNLNNLFFLDIETVSCVPSFEDLKVPINNFWLKKAHLLGAQTEEAQKALFFEKAGIFAEFGKIVTISAGWFQTSPEGKPILYVKGISHDEEQVLLQRFKELLDKFQFKNVQICGHNIKEFDIPYICRRMTVNHMPLPGLIDIAGKKPWEVNHIDTMELWKFGDRKNYTSLDLLAHLFNIPSSKSIMQNHEVNHYYYIKKDLLSIQKYCNQDVVATARLFLALNFLPSVPDSSIVFV
ncbi:MAG: 3'-5' exonuclease [Bacteroidota bacterium]